VGFIPQTNNVFPSLTIEENLQMGIFQEPGKYNERLEFVVSIFAELGKRLKQRAGSLSGGERQMVAMGRALMIDPSVLLLDEPFSALDVDLRQRLAREVADLLRDRGVAAVHVTHDPAEAMAIADHVVNFNDLSP
jgi:branched-chain amino acid transport system ATP-binding protein